MPSIDLPDIPLPSFQIDIELPGWVQAVLESKPYWVPIVVGIVLAAREVKRRKRLRRRRPLGFTACSSSRHPTVPPTRTRTSSRAPRPCSCSATARAAVSARPT